MLLTAPVGLAGLFAWPVWASLAACEFLVERSADMPGACLYVPDLPAWWLWVFYLVLFAFLTIDWFTRRHLAFTGFCLVWLCLGLTIVLGLWRRPAFNCTFLAVGHGGCTVIETADGRVFLYDAGAIGGPEVTRRHIAP